MRYMCLIPQRHKSATLVPSSSRDRPWPFIRTLVPPQTRLSSTPHEAVYSFRRRVHDLKKGVNLINSGMSNREAAQRVGVVHSTLYRESQRVRASIPLGHAGRLPGLMPTEEAAVCDLITHYAHRETSLDRESVRQAVAIIVENMPQERRKSLRFKNGVPGDKFIGGFIRRNEDRVGVFKTSKQEAVRYRACNADTIIDHLIRLNEIIVSNNIEQSRIFNIDETGLSPEKTLIGKKRKFFGESRVRLEYRQPDFQNVNHITILPVVSASGEWYCPLFVIKGQSLPSLEYETMEGPKVQSLASCLPRILS